LEGGSQAAGIEFAKGEDDGCSASGGACCYSGLVITERDGYERDAFREGFKDGVEASVGDDGGCAFEEFKLWGIADDDGIAGKRT